MKRFSGTTILAVFALITLAIAPAGAQTPTVTTPQSVEMINVFNAVTAPQTSGCLSNVGQTVHFVYYSTGGATGSPAQVQIRLEASYNSDAATCATGTWIPISDDGIEPGQNGNNLLLAIGNFPFLRLNLVACGTCDSNDTISANYSGTSSIPGNPFGTYGAGQQIRKVITTSHATGTTNFSPITSPYGSTAGILFVVGTNVFSAGAQVSVRCRDGGNTLNVSSASIATTGGLAIPQPATQCSVLDVRCVCTISAGTYTIFYFFYPPGSALPATAQPSNANNAETTAVASTASVSLAPSSFQRGHVFAVSGRCSAGTAQLLVVDTTASVNLWSSGATEVGTTTFSPPHWNPGLTSALSGHTIQVQLTTCGVANTGTLDVQGSVF